MPRYVVLHHTGHPEKRTHFDWMLERDGLLRTWIVEDPSLSSGAAIQSFDHRLLYVDHEGPVAGDRGEVRRVASGSYEVLEWDERRIRVRMDGEVVTLATDQPPAEGAVWRLSREPSK
jgi:hypothetical protein